MKFMQAKQKFHPFLLGEFLQANGAILIATMSYNDLWELITEFLAGRQCQMVEGGQKTFEVGLSFLHPVCYRIIRDRHGCALQLIKQKREAMRKEEKVDEKSNKLLKKLPKKVQQMVNEDIEQIYEYLKKKISFVQISGEQVSRDTILAIKVLSMSPERALIVTHSQQRAQFLYGLCKQIDLQGSSRIFAVGKFNSITIDRKQAADKEVLIGDLDRLLYLIEKLYVKVFILNNLIIDDISLLIDKFGFDRIKQLIKFLPSCNKTYFYSKEPPEKMRAILQNM